MTIGSDGDIPAKIHGSTQNFPNREAAYEDLNRCAWRYHDRGLFQMPIAA
jgi:hypothetical protein